VERNQVTLPGSAQVEPVDHRRVPAADLLDDIGDAVERRDAEHRHAVPGRAGLLGHARGRGHVSERAAQRWQRFVAMEMSMGDRALHPARAGERDQCRLDLGVAIHGTPAL
jgi:hypothetical protein